MYSSCNTKWWIAWAWIWRHETTSKRKLAYEWPTAHMSKNLIHNNVSFLFFIFCCLGIFFPLHSIYLRNFWKESKNRLFLQFLMNFYFVARLPISPNRRILVYSAKNGIRTRTDIPVQKIFSPHLLLYKPTWLSSRCGPAHFSTISEMLRNSNRIVISCIECLNVIPHGYFQRRCFLYVLYTIYDYDYSYDFM